MFIVILICCAGLITWIGTIYNLESDWTANGRNTLSETSKKLLSKIDEPVQIEAYIRQTPALRRIVTELVARYQREGADMALEFVNPDLEPSRARAAGVENEGELIIHYQGRREQLRQLNETALSDALLRLTRSAGHWVVFIEGHGERRARGVANHDLGSFVAQLENKGFRIQELNLVAQAAIPDNTSLLVLANPRKSLLEGEAALIKTYLAKGGNLLWLTEPDAPSGLDALAANLGLHMPAGIVVDGTAQVLGLDNPLFALVAEYPPHPITEYLDNLSLFPRARIIQARPGAAWQKSPILMTTSRAWLETGQSDGKVKFDQATGDIAGPLPLGVALEKTVASDKQRVVVIGDADFLSNAYLGNGVNLVLGLNIFNWLGNDDQFLDLKPRTAPDSEFSLTALSMVMISLTFLILIPLSLIVSGLVIWARRNRR